MLVVEAIRIFAVFFCVEGVVAGGHTALMDLVAARWCLDLSTSVSNCCCAFACVSRPNAYPEIDFQIAAAAKLSVANLECDRHLVVLVQLFVEAFALVGLHLDVVRRSEREQTARSGEKTKGREQHLYDGLGRLLCCVAAFKGWC